MVQDAPGFLQGFFGPVIKDKLAIVQCEELLVRLVTEPSLRLPSGPKSISSISLTENSSLQKVAGSGLGRSRTCDQSVMSRPL